MACRGLLLRRVRLRPTGTVGRRTGARRGRSPAMVNGAPRTAGREQRHRRQGDYIRESESNHGRGLPTPTEDLLWVTVTITPPDPSPARTGHRQQDRPDLLGAATENHPTPTGELTPHHNSNFIRQTKPRTAPRGVPQTSDYSHPEVMAPLIAPILRSRTAHRVSHGISPSVYGFHTIQRCFIPGIELFGIGQYWSPVKIWGVS